MATITLEISEELTQKLQRRSAAEGGDLAKTALEILKKELHDPATATDPDDLPYDVWRERFEAWIKSVPQVNIGFVDDSRETIYEGR